MLIDGNVKKLKCRQGRRWMYMLCWDYVLKRDKTILSWLEPTLAFLANYTAFLHQPIHCEQREFSYWTWGNWSWRQWRSLPASPQCITMTSSWSYLRVLHKAIAVATKLCWLNWTEKQIYVMLTSQISLRYVAVADLLCRVLVVVFVSRIAMDVLRFCLNVVAVSIQTPGGCITYSSLSPFRRGLLNVELLA